jgi:hypothetical protein
MRTARLLVAATISFASLPLVMAQQVDATAQQNTSATAAGVSAGHASNADTSLNANHGHADASASTNASGSASAHGASAGASSHGSSHASEAGSMASASDMRQVSGELEGKLDSKTAKAGDEVVLKTTQKFKTAEGVVVPKGSRLVGHVTEVQAHSKQQAESHLGLEFDRVELRGGQSMAIHSMIESVSPSAGAVAGASMADEEALEAPMGGGAIASGAGGGGRIGGGLVGGATGDAAMATSHVGSGIGSTVHATSGVGGEAAGFGREVSGVANGAGFAGARATGIQGVMLNGEAAGAASGTLSAADRNVHLDSGTQIVLGIAATR